MSDFANSSAAAPSLLPLMATYLRDLEKICSNPLSTPEISLRPTLFKALQETQKALQTSVEIESSTGIHLDQTDFALKSSGVAMGYIEAEKVETDLDNLQGQSKIQNDAFIVPLDKFLLTNHYDFRIFDNGSIAAQFVLPQNPEDLKLSDEENWKNLFEKLFRVDGKL
jgi:hypothetical protein